MKKIKVKLTSYPEDVERIAQAMKNAGYWCSFLEAELMWDQYSDSMCAGWMMLPETDKRIVSCIRPFFEVENESFTG